MTTVWNTRLLIKSIHHYLILFANTAERLNMIKGISNERLKEYRSLRLDAEELLDRIIDECKELPDQQWKTIDEFMAEPIEGWCFLIHRKFNNRTMGNYSLGMFWIDGEISKEEHITHVMPITTPEAPK